MLKQKYGTKIQNTFYDIIKNNYKFMMDLNFI